MPGSWSDLQELRIKEGILETPYPNNRFLLAVETYNELLQNPTIIRLLFRKKCNTFPLYTFSGIYWAAFNISEAGPRW